MTPNQQAGDRMGIMVDDMSQGGVAADASLERNKHLVRQFIDAWNTHRSDVLRSVTASTFVWRSIEGRERGLDEYAAGMDISRYQSVEIEDMVAEGTRVMIRLHMLLKDGQQFRTHDLFRIESGLIAEEWSGHA